MKKSARNRIIIWSIVSVVLTAVLVLGILNVNKLGTISLNPINISEITNVNVDEFTTGEAEIDKDTVKSLYIEWVSGDVNVVYGESDKIVLTEESSSTSEDDKMCWNVDDNGKLRVYSSKKSKTFIGLFNDDVSKTLTVTVPKDMKFDDFDISSASADVNVEFVNANKVIIGTASGDIEVRGINSKNVDISNVSGKSEVFCQQVDTIEMEAVSGEIIVDGNYSKLSTESISGKSKISAEADNVDINSESVSGEINISLIESISGFTAEYESVSGSFECDFAGKNRDDKFIYGNGMAEIDVETVSGNISVESYSATK